MRKFAKTILAISILIFAICSISNYSFAANTTTNEPTRNFYRNN